MRKVADILDVNNANTERIIGKFVFWLLMLFVLVAAIGAAGLGDQVYRATEQHID